MKRDKIRVVEANSSSWKVAQVKALAWYQGNLVQGIVAFLIVANFVVNIVQVDKKGPEP
jgi:large-conductance mechanosensitive channel